MMDKSNIALIVGGLNLVLLGVLHNGTMDVWSWSLATLGLMIMMYVIAPNARRR